MRVFLGQGWLIAESNAAKLQMKSVPSVSHLRASKGPAESVASRHFHPPGIGLDWAGFAVQVEGIVSLATTGELAQWSPTAWRLQGGLCPASSDFQKVKVGKQQNGGHLDLWHRVRSKHRDRTMIGWLWGCCLLRSSPAYKNAKESWWIHFS